MSNHYLDLFSYRMYVNSEYKQYEQFIFDSFFQKIIGTYTKSHLVFHWNHFIDSRFIHYAF